MNAYYNSIETFGAVDGPGIRLVIFLQGCFLRCKYCHNPETIAFTKEKQISVNEVIKLYEKNKNFYESGGITLSGGEPTAQIEFCISLFKKCKELNINTCLDTAFSTFHNIDKVKEKWIELLKYTDIVLADIKHIDNKKHLDLTGKPNEEILMAVKFLDENGTKMWIRHVLVPGYTDDKEDLIRLGQFIGTLKNMERFEILPYHNMMIPKYRRLNMKFYLDGVIPPTKEYASKCKDIVDSGMKSVLKIMN
ncbi:pyruvate formate-lyase-activating protein [Spiroplasma endosymbiont of Labia minor]|uniref:pyruvate formate-lyase-activating protein n=1 Tax=Spiroplasma endosymbiont of Labia minor TaxID=3066305 RepID=UPI0030CB750C